MSGGRKENGGVYFNAFLFGNFDYYSRDFLEELRR